MAWCLKAVIVEPEQMTVPTEQLGKHTSTTTDTHTTIEELVEAVSSMWSVLRLYAGDQT
jgi:hypothetical protein